MSQRPDHSILLHPAMKRETRVVGHYEKVWKPCKVCREYEWMTRVQGRCDKCRKAKGNPNRKFVP